MWNKKQLSKEQVYGEEAKNLIDDSFIYFEDNTCIEIKENQFIKFYKLENPFSIDIPLYKYKKILHREDGPAIEYYNGDSKEYLNGSLIKDIQLDNGIKIREIHYKNDCKIYEIIYYENGSKKQESYFNGLCYNDPSRNYYVTGKYHRVDGPAYQSWNRDGIKTEEYYYIDGKYHREDGPAYQIWHKGNKIKEYYYINNDLHRENGPAYQIWSYDGSKIEESYYLDGYAKKSIIYKNGKIKSIDYWKNGKKLKGLQKLFYGRKQKI